MSNLYRPPFNGLGDYPLSLPGYPNYIQGPAGAGSGQVNTVFGGNNIDVNSSHPDNPVVSVIVNNDTATDSGGSIAFQSTDGDTRLVLDPSYAINPNTHYLAGSPYEYVGAILGTNVACGGTLDLQTSVNFLDSSGNGGTINQVLTSRGTGAGVVWSYPISGLSIINNSSFSIYYIPVPVGSITDNNAIVQTTLQVPDGATQNWIVDAYPYYGLDNLWYIKVEFSFAVTNIGTRIAWFIAAPTCTPSSASSIPP